MSTGSSGATSENFRRVVNIQVPLTHKRDPRPARESRGNRRRTRPAAESGRVDVSDAVRRRAVSFARARGTSISTAGRVGSVFFFVFIFCRTRETRRETVSRFVPPRRGHIGWCFVTLVWSSGVSFAARALFT